MAARRKKPDLSHIAEPLRELAVPVDSLTPDPANARTHGRRNLAAIRASLAKFGQRMPIVVQRNGMVVRAGNGRLEAAREMGDDPRLDQLLELIGIDRAELDEALGLLPVSLFAERWRMRDRELVDVWRRQPSSPTLVRVKRGRYLVRVAEIPAWIAARSEITPDQARRRGRAIRREVRA